MTDSAETLTFSLGEPREDVPRRVILFATCLVDHFFPGVGEASVYLLEKSGAEVDFPEGLTCCGLPHFNNGFRGEARKVLEPQLALLEGDAPIVVPSGSWGSSTLRASPRKPLLK